MTETQQQITESLITDLQNGSLTDVRLRQKISAIAADTDKQHQDILYLQVGNTSPASQAIGMTYIEAGVLKEASSDPDDWQYQTVLDAVQDGWRIISFPNMALLAVSDEDAYGLGFEFILERWR
ncbi:MAG: hypothetical protein OXN17_04170 [Candidatus Poribacteria bacterium]|nr:hypothetical protein [Candidatus Poribacteria bacterium]MDE0503183.1 hypothetical protein [Candidatus Poribacteria bacterium]